MEQWDERHRQQNREITESEAGAEQIKSEVSGIYKNTEGQFEESGRGAEIAREIP